MSCDRGGYDRFCAEHGLSADEAERLLRFAEEYGPYDLRDDDMEAREPVRPEVLAAWREGGE